MIQRDTERMAYDDRGRNWRYVATSQGMSLATKSWEKPRGVPPQNPQMEHGPANTFIGTSSLRNCERIHFCCLKLPSL